MAFQLLQSLSSATTTANCPDSANLSITDNLDLRARIIVERWVAQSGDYQTIIAKRQGGDEWVFRITPTGFLEFVWWDTGGTPSIETSSVAPSALDGTTLWVRTRRSGTSVDFWTSTSDTNDHTAVSWSALGATQTTPAGNIRSNVATTINLGSAGNGGGDVFNGFYYAVAIVDNVTTRADPVFADSAEWTVGEDDGDTASDGVNTWTLRAGGRIIGDNVQGAHVGLSAAFGNNFFDDAPIWADLTSDMRAVSFRRGRQYELDRIDAGTMTVTLSNNDGQYNAHNTAGTYYPNIKPMVPIRLRAVYDGTIYPLWRGFVERWPVSFPAQVDSVVDVQCVDLFKSLSLADASQPDRTTAVEALSPVAWWRFADDTDSAGGNNTLTFAGSPTEGGAAGPWEGDVATTFDGVDDNATVASEADVEREGLDRTWEIWCRPTSNDTELIIDVSSGGSTFLSGLSWFGATDTFRAHGAGGSFDVASVASEWHHIVLTYDVTGGNTTLNMYLDGVLSGSRTGAEPSATWTVTLGGSTAVFFTGDISEIAVYPTALTSQQVAGLYSAQFEAFATERTDERIAYVLSDSAIGIGAEFVFTDLEEGQTTMSGVNSPTEVSALEAIQAAADTELGQFFMTADGYARFHDRHYRLMNQETPIDTFGPSDLPYINVVLSLDDERIYNEIRVAPSDASEPFIASDETSIESYGRRTLSLTVYPDDQNEAYDFAHYLKQNHAEPTTRIESAQFRLGGDAVLWPIILAAELGNRYTIDVPLAGDDLAQDVFLEAVSHTITAGKTWDVNFQLSPATDDTFWLLGVAGSSELDETTNLGF